VAEDESYIAKGFVVHNCAHDVSPYIPGLSPDLEVRVSKEEQALIDQYGYKKAQEIAYKAQVQQRYIERQIRSWKKRELTSLDDVAKAKAHRKVLDWQKLQREHLQLNPFLPRKYDREAVKGWQGMRGASLIKTTPSFPSVPKKTLERAMYDPDYLSQMSVFQGDLILQDMAEEVGFHRKPTLLSKEKMDAYIQQGNRELFRGIGGRQGEAETYVEQFKTGEYFAGKGVYGNGIYTAYGEDGMEVAKQFANEVEKNVLRISLEKDAKIISYDALIDMQKLEFTALQDEERALRRKARKEADRIYDETGDDDKVEMFLEEAAKKWEEMEKYQRVLADPGRYALYKGYDAIDIPSSRFMVVLNRGKVFVQK
jgi:hypothetical protein